MTHVVMLLSNAFRPDPRVQREALALTQPGRRVTIVCWDRRAEFPEQENLNNIQIIRVQNIRSTYGSGPRQLFYLPRFWQAAVRLAMKLQPDIIHCHDLDTLYAGVIIKNRLKCCLVYDAHEDYPALMSLYLPGLMVKALTWLEFHLLKNVDHTITASNVVAKKLRNYHITPVTTIGNYQPLDPFDVITEAEITTVRARLGLKLDDFIITYIGGFSRNREILPLIEAANSLPNVQVLIWGEGHQKEAIREAASQIPNVHYLGWLPLEQVPLHFRMSDVIYYCLRPDYPGAVCNAPNTLSNAMAAGRPIIANNVGDLGQIIQETNCGIILTEVTPEAIRAAIESLRDPATRHRMGQAGRAAAESHYNWAIAKRLLNEVYQRLGQ